MKKFSKILALALTLLIALSMFAACTETAAPAESTAPAEGDAVEADDAEEMSYDMTLRWVLVSGGGKQKDADMVAEEFNAQLQEFFPGLTVEFDYWMPSEYKERFDLAMAGGETIDIAWKGYMMNTSEYFQSGTFVDLAPFVAEDAEITDALPQFLFDAATVEGTLCYLPKYEMHHWMEGLYTPKAAYEAYFDADAFAAANEDYRANQEYRHYTDALYDVIENYMAAADAAGELGSGYSPYVSVMDNGVDIVTGSPGLQNVAFPVSMRVPAAEDVWDTTLVNQYELEEVEAFYAKLAEWKDMGYLRNDLLTLENPRQYENTNAEGDLVWYHNYVNENDPELVGVHERIGSERGWETDYNVLPIGTPVLTNGSSDGLCIPYTAQDPAVSYEVMKLMFTDEGKELRNTLVWGLEDVHYTKVDDNRIEQLEGSGQLEEDNYGLPTWGLGNVHQTWLLPSQADNLYSYYDEMVTASFVAPTIGFNYVPGDFDAELTNIRNVCAMYVPSFNAGDYTPEMYDEFLAALAETQIADVQADMQAQLDAFLAA